MSHTWAVHEGLPSTIDWMLHMRALPCTWVTRELYVSHMWAVREGLPSTIDWMLHVRALPCMWATRELYVRGSPPPLIECYTWGHYHARELHVSHTWATHELYVRGSPPPLIECYTWGHYRAREPHVTHNVCALLPSTFQKKWPKNRPSTT